MVWSAGDCRIADVDLLLVGAPTHNEAASSSSRRIAARRGIDVDSSGVREWIASADLSGVPTVFTFDTQVSLHSGSAARTQPKLKRRGAHVEQGEGFFITGDTVLQAGRSSARKNGDRGWPAGFQVTSRLSLVGKGVNGRVGTGSVQAGRSSCDRHR